MVHKRFKGTIQELARLVKIMDFILSNTDDHLRAIPLRNMDRQEQIGLLQRSVAEWNLWRQEHPGARPFLSGSQFRNADLSAANLNSAILINANLTGATLER